MYAKRPSLKFLGGVTLGAAILATSLLAATPAFALWPFDSKPAVPSPTAAQASGQAPATNAASASKTAPATADAAPRKPTAQERAEIDRLDPLARATYWQRVFQADPKDAEAGVALASALRAMGRNEEAVQTASQVLVTTPKYVPALLEAARGLIGDGQPFYAIDPLKQAQALAPKDFWPVNLLGMAYEQTERPDEALAAYKRALALAPDNPAVLSNLALFYAGRGDTGQAETLLRRVLAQPNTTVQERQDLALVLGLQGKLAEAEKLMRQDLPPEVVANNLTYFKTAAQSPAVGGASPASPTRRWNTLEGVQDKTAPRTP